MAEQTNHSTARDFFGIVFIALTLYIMIAMMTWSPKDPSFNKGFSESVDALNSGGIVGSYVSDGLAQAFGSGAFFFPMITFIFGWSLIRGPQNGSWKMAPVPGIAFLGTVCALISIHYYEDPFFGENVPAGGMAGSVFGDFLISWLSQVGATLFLVTAIAICLLAMTGKSVNQSLESLGKFVLWGANRIRNACLVLKQQVIRLVKALKKTRIEPKKEKRPLPEPLIVLRKPKPEPLPFIDVSKSKKKEAPADFVVQEDFDFVAELGVYKVPPLSLLDDPPPPVHNEQANDEILAGAAILEKKLRDFGVEGKVVQVLPGPLITLYEYEPAPGIKVSRIVSLADDLALAMRAMSLRILAPVPGKPVVGIEVPNLKRETIYFKDVISSQEFAESESKLTMVIGKDSFGEPMIQDLAKVPHLLLAGSTGSGKSVGLNAMICSILLNASPDEVKFIMVDPKMLELSIFDGIPHLISPVVTNPKKAAAALQWAVTEMESRYKLMAECGVRNLSGYNKRIEKLQKEYEEAKKKFEKEEKLRQKTIVAEDGDDLEELEILPEPPKKLPFLVVVIDELADLMMVASKGVEDALIRLAQMARASGIHLILATQRPSVDVLTGIIKANFPSRISYKVTSRVDSRTILDSMGAEKLLGRGDMLFLPPGTNRLLRAHGAMLSDEEINRIIDFIKKQGKPEFSEELFQEISGDSKDVEGGGEDEYDEKYDEALEIVAKDRQASISYIQRRLRIGYNRAARIIETMEREGVVGPSDGVRPREIYVTPIVVD
ncbi:MAG: cell division protein FtsK [Nitrospinae bacterium CG11_big_fil_rev_8_21_14_0_20_45_15]|nr:MAG: cell division protein FtsK [Nitrospinae bacterium CG11_big_fil_rev_8_21_14_0_20_45_15]